MKIRPVIGRTLVIGRQGENGATKVDFNDIIDNFINDFGEGEAIIMIQRPNDEVIYPVNLKDGIWTVSSTDTAKKGEGKAQISFYKDDVLAKSVVIKTRIKEGLGAIGSVPEPGKDFIEELIKKVGKSGITIEKVEKVEGGYTLKLSSGEVLQIKDGGAGAKGEDGKDGADGISPIVKIEDIENGKKVVITDKDGEKSFNILNGVDGEKGQDGKDGENGKSPIVEVSEENNGNRITFRDADGIKSVFIKNGKDGETGAKGEDGKDGLKGENGKDGADGSDGISPTVKIEDIENGKKVVITDKEGEKSFNILNGEKGKDGTTTFPDLTEEQKESLKGADGVSPTVKIEEIENGKNITITDKDGDKTFTILNGEKGKDGVDGSDGAKGENGKDGSDGADGISPIVKIEDIENGKAITITDKDGAKSFNILNGVDGKNGADGQTGAKGEDGVSPTVEIRDKNIIITDKNGEKTYALPTGGSSSGVEVIGTNLYIKDGENITDIVDLRSNDVLSVNRRFTKEQANNIKTKLYKIGKKFYGVRKPDVNILDYAKSLGIDVSALDDMWGERFYNSTLAVIYRLINHQTTGTKLDKNYLMIPNINKMHMDIMARISEIPYSIEDSELRGKLENHLKEINDAISQREEDITNYFYSGYEYLKNDLGDPTEFVNSIKEKLNAMHELLSRYDFGDNEEVENYKTVLQRDLELYQPIFQIDLFFGLQGAPKYPIIAILQQNLATQTDVEQSIKNAFNDDLFQKALVNVLTNSDDIKELIRKVVKEA